MCSAVPMSVQEEVIGEDLDHLYANVSAAHTQTHTHTYNDSDRQWQTIVMQTVNISMKNVPHIFTLSS